MGGHDVGRRATVAAYVLCIVIGAWGAAAGNVALLLGGLVGLAIMAQASQSG